MNSAELNAKMLTALSGLSEFLRPINKYWPKELDGLIKDGQAALTDGDPRVRRDFLQRVETALDGKSGLEELFMSSPSKREPFAEKKASLRESLRLLNNENV